VQPAVIPARPGSVRPPRGPGGAAVLLAAALLGCAGWPAFDPDDRGGALDPRLGDEVFRTPGGLRIASLWQADGLLLVFEDLGRGWHARRVDPESGAIVELPAPPLAAREGLRLGRAWAPVRAVLATTREGATEVHRLDAAGWTTLPPLPSTGSADTVGAILAYDDVVWATASGRVFRWSGAWTEPVVAGGGVRLAGFDAATQWLVATVGAGFAGVPVAADGTVGTPVAGPDVGGPIGAPINGDGDGFQVLAGGTMWWFDGERFLAGDPAEGVPAAAPGSRRVLVRVGAGTGATWTAYDEGGEAGVVLAPFVAEITCACDAALDPGCGCVPHPVGYVDVDPAPSADRIALTLADTHHGYAVLSVRFLDLPLLDDPFAP
jgi:hypothetical protein